VPLEVPCRGKPAPRSAGWRRFQEGESRGIVGGLRIVINGEERTVDAELSLAALVRQLGMKPDRVAVELNRSIVPRDRWPEAKLQEGDRLEVVQFVGGGSYRLRCKRNR
jgi:sulfur carrier protein